MTDTDRIDFLQSLTDESGKRVICRWSNTSRGWRLHETSDRRVAEFDVRDAIDEFIEREQKRRA